MKKNLTLYQKMKKMMTETKLLIPDEAEVHQLMLLEYFSYCCSLELGGWLPLAPPLGLLTNKSIKDLNKQIENSIKAIKTLMQTNHCTEQSKATILNHPVFKKYNTV